MSKNAQIHNDEINIIELILNIWKGKWKIAAIIVISILSATVYESIQSNSAKNSKKNFIATTQVNPLTTEELNKYLVFNNLKVRSEPYSIISSENSNINMNSNNYDNDKKQPKINNFPKLKIKGVSSDYFFDKKKITKNKLLKLYFEILNERTVFENAIRKYNLIDVNQFSNKEAYNQEILKLVSRIKISQPKTNIETNNENLQKNEIKFTYNDSEKWKKALSYVDEQVNQIVKKNLQNQFNLLLQFEKKNKEYRIEDMDLKINNLVIDYERKTSDKLEFLQEQSQIARKLGILKNTIEVQTFDNQNILLSNVKADSPFYLRGYEAIDKEIELIKSRTNQRAFIPELFEYEKIKRMIEQNKDLERAELLFLETPIGGNNKFYAASLNVKSTVFNNIDIDKISVPMPLAAVFGLIIGVFYVLIVSAIESQKIYRKK